MNIYVNEDAILFNVANMHLWTCMIENAKDGSRLAKYYNSEGQYVCWLKVYNHSDTLMELKGRYANADINCNFNLQECTDNEILSIIEQRLMINLMDRIKTWII